MLIANHQYCNTGCARNFVLVAVHRSQRREAHKVVKELKFDRETLEVYHPKVGCARILYRLYGASRRVPQVGSTNRKLISSCMKNGGYLSQELLTPEGVIKKFAHAHSALIQNRQFRARMERKAISNKSGEKYNMHLGMKVFFYFARFAELVSGLFLSLFA